MLISQRVVDGAREVLEPAGVEVVERDSDEPLTAAELATAVHGFDGLICLLTDHVTREVLEANPQLRVVANVAAGYDNVDVAAAAELGVVVTNTPDSVTESTADLTWALLLAAARRLPEGESYLREGRWRRWEIAPPYMGIDVHGKTLGIVGMGRIGTAVGRRAVGFGMRVLYTNRSGPLGREQLGYDAHHRALDQLLAEADIVSLHLPLTEATRHIIDAAALERMRPGALLINTGRGPLVDEAALVRALEQGRIAGAGLDVFEHEPQVHEGLLRHRRHVVLQPHVGSATVETRRHMVVTAAVNARAVLVDGGVPPNPVTPIPAR